MSRTHQSSGQLQIQPSRDPMAVLMTVTVTFLSFCKVLSV